MGTCELRIKLDETHILSIENYLDDEKVNRFYIKEIYRQEAGETVITELNHEAINAIKWQQRSNRER